MSRTYDVPFTINGERVGNAVLTEQDDGAITVGALLFREGDHQAVLDALKFQVNDTSVSIREPSSPERRVGQEDDTQ